jgi:hypothetical protein
MRIRLLPAVLTCLALATGICAAAAQAAPGDDDGVKFLAAVDGAAAAGEITTEDALVYKLAYGFAPDTLPARFRPERIVPLKCGTMIIAEYARMRPTMASNRVKQVDAWLAPPSDPVQKSVYDSPLGYFTLTYSITGTNAVPAEDTSPANGIPDFVEKVAGYLDYSWNYEVTTLGFAAPPTGSATYQIDFESMGFYGYTTPVDSTLGTTRITMHNTFLGFPANTDPEGNQWGAAKVTAAHEFKHASQYAASLWSEIGWRDVDATWMEDLAYNDVNDYYNYLSGSPIADPTTSLDNGGTGGSYEDCIWQRWMSDTWGTGIIRDLWIWRNSHQSEPMMDSYNQVLSVRGSSVAQGLATFAAWNYATGTRAVSGLGYAEAVHYPTGPATTIFAYPGTKAGAVAYEAADFIRCANLPAALDTVRVHFNGADGSLLRLTAVITRRSGTGFLVPIELDANNDADTILTAPLDQIAALGLVVSNGATSGSAKAYDLSVRIVTMGGKLVAWAYNNFGQCNVPSSDGFVAVSAGTAHGLGLKADGSIVTWGDNSYGQRNVPSPNADFVAVEAGYNHSVGLKANGSIVVWGDNTYGQRTGMGNFPSPNTGFVAVSAGGIHSLGLKADGSIVAWGYSGYGLCTVPSPNTGFVAVSAGGWQSLGLKADGSIIAWGTDYFGVCTVPSPNAGFVAVAAGYEHNLGLKGDGSIVAWGKNDNGQCTVPTPNTGFRAVAAGGMHSVGLKSGGSVVTWGDNTYGQCTVPSPSTGFVSVAAGGAFSVGVKRSIPQAVYLSQFNALRRGQDALVQWTISQPRDHAGFHLWREEAGHERARLSAALLSGQTAYNFTDSTPPTGPADYWLQEVETNGLSNWYGPAHLEAASVPSALRLYSAAPNPFNPRTTIRFDLPAAGNARLAIYDVAGRLVKVLVEGEIPAGSHEAAWDGRDSTGRSAPSGSYLARLVAGGKVEAVRLSLVR